MKHKPIQIPDNIAAKYGHDGQGQGQVVDEAIKTIIGVPANKIPLYKHAEKRAKGRPKKA